MAVAHTQANVQLKIIEKKEWITHLLLRNVTLNCGQLFCCIRGRTMWPLCTITWNKNTKKINNIFAAFATHSTQSHHRIVAASYGVLLFGICVSSRLSVARALCRNNLRCANVHTAILIHFIHLFILHGSLLFVFLLSFFTSSSVISISPYRLPCGIWTHTIGIM